MDGTDGLVKRRISGQRFHISGSASRSTPAETVKYAHQIVRGLTAGLTSKGGRMVVQLGEEPTSQEPGLSTLFDWSILEEVTSIASKGNIPESIQGIPCIAVGFSNWKARIPESRSTLVGEAIDRHVLEIVQLPQTSRVGGLLRERQALYGDVLVTIGGGPGVEHLAQLYRQMHQPIIPLDLPLKPGKMSASEGLYMEAMEEPPAFFEYDVKSRASASLASLSLKSLPEVDDFVARFLGFVTELSAPRAFFAHLLTPRIPDYQKVVTYFDRVVSRVMAESGYSRFDPGKDASEETFLNVEVFKMIQASSIVIVDLTRLRPNCFVELGFALGLGKKVIVTALRGTRLPFDAEAIPCHYWQAGTRNERRRQDFKGFVSLNVNRRGV